ncbi:hypothetical protein M438DRAFT_54886 [Aureobasidium pullulans EXF-150]|uniref:Uncharacterized protein n=1 Tax=Aureobasidium pullulans EXF-150 TaxID=1043002 RepID=A0A074XBC1_AURPU|nr:uncharacterized protein M438DRAFT_54886 [Aureobasidium pullulans EXF-150]KEQ82628.1 hypothetical protein M438DRAFT_54886 [Aureobasidium pullulans EXF-150]
MTTFTDHDTAAENLTNAKMTTFTDHDTAAENPAMAGNALRLHYTLEEDMEDSTDDENDDSLAENENYLEFTDRPGAFTLVHNEEDDMGDNDEEFLDEEFEGEEPNEEDIGPVVTVAQVPTVIAQGPVAVAHVPTGIAQGPAVIAQVPVAAQPVSNARRTTPAQVLLKRKTRQGTKIKNRILENFQTMRDDGTWKDYPTKPPNNLFAENQALMEVLISQKRFFDLAVSRGGRALSGTVARACENLAEAGDFPKCKVRMDKY